MKTICLCELAKISGLLPELARRTLSTARSRQRKNFFVVILLSASSVLFSQTRRMPVTSLDSVLSNSKRLGFLRGHVCISSTETPLPGVRISLANTKFLTQTNGRGEFTFSYLPPASYTLNAVLPGYTFLSSYVFVGRQKECNLSLALTPEYSRPELHTTGSAEIFVFEANTGRPKDFEQISLVEVGRVGTIGLNGSYRADHLPPGRYHIKVTSPWDRVNILDSVEVTAGALSVRLIAVVDSSDVRNGSCPLTHRKLRSSTEIHQFEGCSISGTLRDVANGDSVRDAHVFLAPYADEAYSDTAGHFTIPNLRSGRYCLTITSIGYSRTTIHGIVIEPKEHVFLNLLLEPAMTTILN
jgi:hypothetical protein